MTLRCPAIWLLAIFLALCGVCGAAPLGTAFTYQGELQDQGTSANGAYDFEFALYDIGSGGAALSTQTLGDVVLADGRFTVELDYTDVPFQAGLQYYLEVRVRRGNETGSHTPLLPRQKITAVPYALSVKKACPAGFLRSGSLCIRQSDTDIDPSVITFTACAARCVSMNAHMCTSAEIRAAIALAIPTSSLSQDWIADQTGDDVAMVVNQVVAENPDTTSATSAQHYCRCCASLE